MPVNQGLAEAVAQSGATANGDWSQVWDIATQQVESGGATWQDVWDTATANNVSMANLAQGAGVTEAQLRATGTNAGVTGLNGPAAPAPAAFIPPPAPTFAPPPVAAPYVPPAAPTFTAPTAAPAPTFTAPRAAPAPTFTAPTAVNVEAAQHTIDPTTETVQGQLAGIINEDGPLMQQAAARGLDMAGSRGLSNSSTAVGAAHGAVMDRATPIAASDAATYFQKSMQNLGYTNAARQQNAAAANQLNMAGFQANVTAAMTAYSAQQEFAMAGFQANFQSEMARWSADTQAQMTAFQANVTGSMTAYTATINAMATGNQQAFEAGMAQYQATFNSQMTAYNAAIRSGELSFQAQSNMELQMAGDAAKMQQLQFQASSDVALQTLRNNASIELAGIEAQFKTQIQANDSAKSLYAQISKNITDIMANADIPAEEKAGMVQQQADLLRSGLAIVGSSGGVNFLSVLDFTGGTGSVGESGAINSGVVTAAPNPAAAAAAAGGSGWDAGNGGAGPGSPDGHGLGMTSADAPGNIGNPGGDSVM